MNVLIVFESMFGNTQQIAQAVGAGMRDARVEILEVGRAPRAVPENVDLLVVGGPTHAFGMTRESTRRSAAQQSEHGVISGAVGIREWLDRLPAASRPLRAAAFDTRVRRPRVPGSAAKAAHRRLQRLGFSMAAPARTFWVQGTPGPLVDGEADRAGAWGADLARQPAGHLS